MDSGNVWKGLAFGGIASCVAEMATLPIDVVKTRMQLQGELGAARQYSGSLDALVKVARSEGVTALWKGVQPALLRQATYGSMRYGLYTPIKRLIGVDPATPKNEIPLVKRILAGAGSGALASAICNPTDLIKVRMQADGMGSSAGQPPRYRSLVHAFRSIVAAEGVRGLYKGVGPTCGRATVLAAAELATYDEVKTQLLHRKLLNEGFGLHVTTAIVAGFVSALASSPFDVVKSRVMNQPFAADGTGTLYKGMVDCFRKSVVSEGPLSLWKGFWPNFGRIGPRVTIIFVIMEQMRHAFDGKKKNKEE